MQSDTTGNGRKVNLSNILQAGLAYSVFFIVGMLSFDRASSLGGWVGRTFGPFLSITKMARRNIARAFPDKSDREIDQIVVGMWDNFGRILFEFPNLLKARLSGDDPHIEYINPQVVEAARNDNLPGIFFTGHIGNWELARRSVVSLGLPVHTIFREVNNPLLHGLLLSHRLPGEGELIPKGARGARRLMRLLKAGEHVGMMPDQKLNEGIPVPFFGRDAMTPPALAHFALRFNCPVIPARIERIMGARFRMTFYPPLYARNTGDRHADAMAFMTEINGMFEDWISERPEQWLWLHRRWPEN